MSSLVILAYILCQINGQTIDPTTTNSTASFYVASDYYNNGNYYKFGSLTCNASYCHIVCDETFGCESLKIYVTSSLTTLVVHCITYGSCYQAVINANTANAVQLYCEYDSKSSTDSGACKYLRLHASNTRSVNIICDGKYACTSADFYASNASNANIICDADGTCSSADFYASNVGNSFTMSCSGSDGCRDANIYCPADVYCNINCSSTDTYTVTDTSCYNTQFHVATEFSILNLDCPTSACSEADIVCEDSGLSSALTYNFWPGLVECEQYDCCAIIFGDITCSPGVSCQIDCDTQTCTNYHINATLATSLTLDCGINGCKGAHIKCPTGISTSCNIQCHATTSCEYAYVETGTNKMSNFKLSCSFDLSCQYMQFLLNSKEISNFYLGCNGWVSCNNTNVTFNSVEKISNLTLDCTGSESCQYMQFVLNSMEISNFYLRCNGLYDSCSFLNVTGSSVINYFNMDCGGRAACSSSYISGKIGFNADVHCIAEEACSNTTISLISTGSDINVDISCVNPSVSTSYLLGACNSAEFNIYGYNNNGVKTNNMSFVCGSNDCYQNRMNGLDFYRFDVHCNASSSCSFATINGEATNQLNVHCDDQRSCYSADIYCPYHRKQACNIDCAAYTDSCTNMNIYVPSNYLDNYLDITCPSKITYAATLISCDNLYIRCTDDNDDVKSPARVSFDYTNNEWNCGAFTGSAYCCPYLATNAPTPPTIKAPTKSPTTTASTTKAGNNAEPTMQPGIAPTTNHETTASINPSTNSKSTKLQNDDSNNSETMIIVIIVFSTLLVIMIIAGILYVKKLNNKIHILQQNSIGVELMETNENENNKGIEMNKNVTLLSST